MQKNVAAVLGKDPVMKKLLDRYGELDMDWEVKDVFSNIVHEIIGQQLSGKASDAIGKRFTSLLQHTDPLTPQEILSIDSEIIRRKAGISYAKIRYIKGLSRSVIDYSIDLIGIGTLSDEDALVELTRLNGIGPWTAEMVLMFTYKRPDVFSLGDAGLRRAIGLLYEIDRRDNQAILRLSCRWKPYRSYASRYLWRSLDNP